MDLKISLFYSFVGKKNLTTKYGNIIWEILIKPENLLTEVLTLIANKQNGRAFAE